MQNPLQIRQPFCHVKMLTRSGRKCGFNRKKFRSPLKLGFARESGFLDGFFLIEFITRSEIAGRKKEKNNPVFVEKFHALIQSIL